MSLMFTNRSVRNHQKNLISDIPLCLQNSVVPLYNSLILGTFQLPSPLLLLGCCHGACPKISFNTGSKATSISASSNSGDLRFPAREGEILGGEKSNDEENLLRPVIQQM